MIHSEQLRELVSKMDSGQENDIHNGLLALLLLTKGYRPTKRGIRYATYAFTPSGALNTCIQVLPANPNRVELIISLPFSGSPVPSVLLEDGPKTEARYTVEQLARSLPLITRDGASGIYQYAFFRNAPTNSITLVNVSAPFVNNTFLIQEGFIER